MDFNKLTYEIIGAAFDVHKELGMGFLEAVYQEALEVEMSKRGIKFEKEKKLQIKYKEIFLNKFYIADFLCEDLILIELKATNAISNYDVSQAINYLKATELKLCMILNFGSESLIHKRVVYNL